MSTPTQILAPSQPMTNGSNSSVPPAGRTLTRHSLDAPLSFLSVLAAASLAAALLAAAWYAPPPGHWVRSIIFDRSWVQYVTVSVFSLGLVLAAQRLLILRREAVAARALVAAATQGAGISSIVAALPPSALRDRLAHLAAFVSRAGAGGARDFDRRQAQRQAAELGAGYSTLTDIVQALPLIGFAGTTLGLSAASIAQGGASGSAGGTLSHAVGISFGTTLLALAATLVVFGLQRWVHRKEQSLLSGSDQRIGELLAELDGPTLAHGDAERAAASLAARVAVRLKEAAREMAESTRAELARAAAESVQVFVGQMAEASKAMLASCQAQTTAHNREFAEALGATLTRVFGSMNQRLDGLTVAHEQFSNGLQAFSEGVSSQTKHLASTVEAVQANVGSLARIVSETAAQPRRFTFVEEPAHLNGAHR